MYLILLIIHFVFSSDFDPMDLTRKTLTAEEKLQIKQMPILDQAIAEHDYELLKKELSSGRYNLAKENVNGVTSLFKAAIANNPETIEMLLKNGASPKDKSLFYCVAHDQLEAAKVLLKYGADPNQKINAKVTPTTLAQFDNNTPMLEILMRKGGKKLENF